MVTLEQMKKYLRVDFEDDDSLIEGLLNDSHSRVMDILRAKRNEDINNFDDISNYDLAVMYCVSYLYEHREDCDFKALNLSLRSLLFGDREVLF